MLDANQGRTLLLLARAAIARELGLAAREPPQADWLQEPGATFVTLNLHGNLRGCIGSLEAHRPLIDDVSHNAKAAAFLDPRFTPLTKPEFAEVVIDVSLLSPPEQIQFSSERNALAQLRPGQDGLILEYGLRRATYLPQVWAQLPKAQEFVNHLKSKAGLPEDFWSDDIKLSRYAVQKWGEGQ